MIALWMGYAIATGILIALLARLLEVVARIWRLPTRGIWVVAMVVMIVVGCAAVVPQGLWKSRAASEVVEGISDPARTEAGEGSGTVQDLSGGVSRIRERGERALVALHASLSEQAKRLDRWNSVLLGSWAALSALLMGTVAHAVVEGRRLRRGLGSSEVGGTSVLLSDTTGPATVGVMAPAILLPRWALGLDKGLLDLVLRHEREHLIARDPMLPLAGSLAVVLLPWHLPLRWSWRRLRLAVEVDCDARVLRAHPDVRRYAEILLLTGQRGTQMPWSRRQVFTVVAPLQPHVSHLTERIQVMTQPVNRSVARSLMLLGAAAVTATAALALPAPTPTTASSDQPAEIAGLYWMVPPDVPSTKMLAPGREFTYLRLAPDGRSRMENVMVDASGERVAPAVDVKSWSTENWKVIPASNGNSAQLCWQLGKRVICSVYQRDAESGDITLYRDKIGSKVELVLRRASMR